MVSYKNKVFSTVLIPLLCKFFVTIMLFSVLILDDLSVSVLHTKTKAAGFKISEMQVACPKYMQRQHQQLSLSRPNSYPQLFLNVTL